MNAAFATVSPRHGYPPRGTATGASVRGGSALACRSVPSPAVFRGAEAAIRDFIAPRREPVHDGGAVRATTARPHVRTSARGAGTSRLDTAATPLGQRFAAGPLDRYPASPGYGFR